MNNKIVAATLVVAGILFLGCCTSINAGTIDNLGTMNYKGFLQVDVPGNANLLFISCSDGMSGSDITMQNVGYQSVINATKYIFTSNVLIPEWWMPNSTVSYLYQEIGALQLYEVIVDYSSMVIPPSPDMVLYQNLSVEYGFLNVSYNNLTMDYSVLNLSFSNLTLEFENLSLNHTNISDILANLTLDYSNSTAYISELEGNLSIRNTKYDLLYTAFTNMSGNISQFESQASNAESKLWIAENDIKDKDGLIAVMPLWFVFIMITVVISIILYDRRHLLNKKWRDPALQESMTGYTNNAKIIDKIAEGLGKVVKKGKDIIMPKHNAKINMQTEYNTMTLPEKQKIKQYDPVQKQDNIKADEVDKAVDKLIG